MPTFNRVLREPQTSQPTLLKKKRKHDASPSGFIKISLRLGVINARARPGVDATVLKVKSRSHSAQSAVKHRPNPLHSRGKENAISHSIKKVQYILESY